VVIEIGTILYRAEWLHSDRIYFQTAVVVKLTPKGFWIEAPPPERPVVEEDTDPVALLAQIKTDEPKRWFSFNTYRWSTTKDEALRHLVARKQAHVRHAKGRLEKAQKVLRAAQAAVGLPEEERAKVGAWTEPWRSDPWW
jgi:hypothetical protein